MLSKWLKHGGPESNKYVPFGDDLQTGLQRIPLREGHAVIWDMGLAHANYEHISTRCRLTQYVRMLPRSKWYMEREKQCIVSFWKVAPMLRAKFLAEKQWTKQELQVLGLTK